MGVAIASGAISPPQGMIGGTLILPCCRLGVLSRTVTFRIQGGKIGVAICLCWAMVSSLSYFNEIAGRPENGADHLVAGNLDWARTFCSSRNGTILGSLSNCPLLLCLLRLH